MKSWEISGESFSSAEEVADQLLINEEDDGYSSFIANLKEMDDGDFIEINDLVINCVDE